MNRAGPLYRYRLTVVCQTCGYTSEYSVLSVNSNKRTVTYRAVNPLTGLHDMTPVVKLMCGHEQDLEGHPVEREREQQ